MYSKLFCDSSILLPFFKIVRRTTLALFITLFSVFLNRRMLVQFEKLFACFSHYLKTCVIINSFSRHKQYILTFVFV